VAKLIALCRIQIGFRDYMPGDILPAGHPDAAAWTQSGAAVWKPDDYQPPARTKAKRAAAEAGLPGLAVGGEAAGENLAGKVPATPQRERRRTLWRF